MHHIIHTLNQLNVFDGTSNPSVTHKPDNLLKGIRNPFPQKPDNSLEGIRNIVPNGNWNQCPIGLTVQT